MNPHDAIATARRLTQSGASLPTQVDLRRAVSTACYALFHCLAGTAADLLTDSRRDPEWQQIYRALEHGKVRSACRQQEAMRAFPMDIRSFAKEFIALQAARHRADYAHDGRYSEANVLALVEAAAGAIDRFERASARYRRRFAVHVLFKRRQSQEIST